MAIRYVRSGAGGAANGTTWADAYTTLSAAFTAASAGDTIYVAHDHAESQGTALTLTSPGTVSAPLLVICANTAAEPPTALATTATVTTSSAGTITINGSLHCYGISFTAVPQSGGSVNFLQTNVNGIQTYDTCKFTGNGTAGTGFNIGINSAGKSSELFKATNCTWKFGAVGQKIGVRCRVFIDGGSVDGTGSAPTALVGFPTGIAGNFIAQGLDVSALGSGKALVDVGALSNSDATFIQCKLGASVGYTTGTFPGQGGVRVEVRLCSAGDSFLDHYFATYRGSYEAITAITRNSGAGAESIGWSYRVITTAATFDDPFYVPLARRWNATEASSITATAQILRDNATSLDNDEVWLELVYMGTAGLPTASFANDRMATRFSTPAAQTTSSAVWSGTGAFTNTTEQECAVSVTPQTKGQIEPRLAVAVNTTLYVCPLVDIS